MATQPPDDRKPSIEPTRPATLAICALATTAFAWILISNFFGDMPTLPWIAPLVMIGLAVLETFGAINTKSRIDRKSGTVPVEPLVVARYVVLAKASAVAGSLFGGLYIGFTTWLLSQRAVLAKADDNLPQAIIGLVGSAVLVVAAIVLERACRVPPSDSDQLRSGRPAEDDRAEDGQSA